jgi:hypothetical protein
MQFGFHRCPGEPGRCPVVLSSFEVDGHESAGVATLVVTKRATFDEAGSGIERAGGGERFHVAGFQADSLGSPFPGHTEEMIDHGPAHAVATCLFGGVDRFQLEMDLVELFDGSDAQEALVVSEAEEGDRGIEETVEVEGVDVFRRCHRSGELQVPLQETEHVGSPGVVRSDRPVGHPADDKGQVIY